MDSKLSNVIRGAFIIVLGVLVAVCGIGAAVNTYFGVVAIIAGVLLLVLSAVMMAKRLPIPVPYLLLSGVLITIAVALFAQKLTFAELINLMVFIIMGLGFALIVLGIIYVAKRLPITGVAALVVGALMVLFTALYLGIDEFRTAFWIIVGILMIVFGVFVIITTLVDKKKMFARR